jgi:hypothetical protein
MKLILTSSESGAGALAQAARANSVIQMGPSWVWGPVPSPAELEASLSLHRAGPRSVGPHRLELAGRRLEEARAEGAELVEFCAPFETVELWADPDPDAQLTLVWLLDYLRAHAAVTSKLALVQAEVSIGNCAPEELAGWQLPAVRIVDSHFDAASMAWRAYRQPTPQDWFDLLGAEITALPQLGQSVLELLEELPMATTGLGATEMQMLELISVGDVGPLDLFPGAHSRNRRRAFGYWEVGDLLDELAHCPEPLVSGLDEGPFTLAMHEDRERLERYRRSRLRLTPLGQAILAGTEDFSRHNPVRRWWGGTELTNDRLWRWDPANSALVAPASLGS